MSMNNLYGDPTEATSWWNKTIGGIGNFFNDVIRASAAGPGNVQGAIPSSMRTPAALTNASARPAAAVSPQSLIPRNLETAGRMGGAYGGGQLGLAPPQMPQQGYGFDQYMADLMSMMGGSGGGVDLSGYNTMLSDVGAREEGLGARRAEQEAFLADLFGAGNTRLDADRAALEQAVQASLASDQARRAQEIGLIRGDEAARLATADQARAALGVEGGADLSSDIAQNAVAGVGAGGSVSERDARIRESIENQQIQSQIAGLIPMQQMATSSLSRNFEDRLAALASERAAIQAQMAQARSAASGRGGLSLNEILNAQQSYNQMFGPGEAPEFGGILGTEQQIQQRFGNDTSSILGIASSVLTSPEISGLDQTSPAEVNEILRNLADADPRIRNFLNRTPGATGAIVSYAVQALAGR